jgi:2-polyprenyl-3-methyl-5-hydroxy-6-metoxy-1,4-benzoquinol methylase
VPSVAAEVVGIDSSEKVPREGLRTGPRSVIYGGDVCNVAELLDARSISPEVIVAGELIEHLPNPLAFLRRFASRWWGVVEQSRMGLE